MDPEANNVPAPEPQELRGGYASLSQFIASNKTSRIFRRFDALAMRNLLYLQNELCVIEQQLAELDKADMTSKVPIDQYSYIIISLRPMHSSCFDVKILAPCYEYFNQVP